MIYAIKSLPWLECEQWIVEEVLSGTSENRQNKAVAVFSKADDELLKGESCMDSS